MKSNLKSDSEIYKKYIKINSKKNYKNKIKIYSELENQNRLKKST